ncbi:MAG TPA: PIG-L deacetylase family protein [Thermomicrobiales bacterium]|nr:PIG-L deacetylase family protein [Thermomicrobiales bacterium]
MTEDQETYQRYLWIVAHPDDAEFSSAGTIHKIASEGKDVVIVQATSGDRGTDNPEWTPETLGAAREKEELEAAKRLGVKKVEFLHEGDGHVMPTVEFREKVVRMIRTYKPDVLVTHDPFRPYALHPDHRGVGITAHDCVYPLARDPLYFPEHSEAGLEPHKTAEIWYFGSEAPDMVVDITDHFEAKIEALKAHETQLGNAEGLSERLRERAQELAKDEPFELGEAFKTVQMRR